jgi:hypothetical protein
MCCRLRAKLSRPFSATAMPSNATPATPLLRGDRGGVGGQAPARELPGRRGRRASHTSGSRITGRCGGHPSAQWSGRRAASRARARLGPGPIWRCAACRRAAVPRVVYAGGMGGLQDGRLALLENPSGTDGCGCVPVTGPGRESGWCRAWCRAASGHEGRSRLMRRRQPFVPPAGFGRSPGVLCRRLKPAGQVDGPAHPARPAGEEWTYAASSHGRPPPPPPGDAPSGRRNHTRREDQDQLRRPGLRGLGPAAVPVAA